MPAPETVKFVNRSPVSYKSYDNTLQVRAYLVMIILTGAAIVLVELGRLFGIPSPVVFAIGGGLCGAAILSYVGWRIWYRVRLAKMGDQPGSIRLRCIGLPTQLLRFGELADLSFEPQFFSASFAQPFSARMKWSVALIAIPTSLSTFAWFGFANWLTYLAVKIWFGYLVGFFVVGFLNPSYFRISPGRVDVMRYRAWRTTGPAIERYNLRIASLIVDLRARAAVIDGHEYSMGIMRHSERFAYFLFLAALSTHSVPPLPDDELLG